MPGPDNEDRSPVALGEEGSESADCGADPKSGCHSFAGVGGGAGDGVNVGGVKDGACWTGGGGVEGVALKNWVKLPSADAESETPGEEKPFIRDGLAAGGVNGGGSTTVFADWLGTRGSVAGTEVFTKIRVNSPGAGLAGGVGGSCDSGPATGL
jgi:hypothetical protein